MIPFETYNRELGVRLSFLLSDGVKKQPNSLCLFSYDSYKKKAQRNKAFRLRQGKGLGNEVLIRWKCLSEYHSKLIEAFGNPEKSHNELITHFELDGKAQLFYELFTHGDDGSHLKPNQITQYALNASVMNAVIGLYKARKTDHVMRGNGTKGVWKLVVEDCRLFNNYLKKEYGSEHTLPKNDRRLADTVRGYTNDGYNYLLDKRARNKNAAKIKTEVHTAMLEQLLRKHNNYDNEQVANFYNIAAEQMGWRPITGATVANYRKEWNLYIYSDSLGANKFKNKKAMQIKRSAPTVSMAYWTLDGWDVELLYQSVETNTKGHRVTTYHNRLCVVVVMDPAANIKYPVGYAIGTHETPELIQEALRNAANHTRDLFEQRYKPLQLQSDHYALKTLKPLYEAMTKHFTPARVKNAKAKTVEPYFLHLNKQCQKYYSNWSGFGVTAEKDNQPNADYLNKIRHSFPDEQGCRAQIEQIIELERTAKAREYVTYFNLLPVEDRLPLSNAEYLYLFGKTHEYTNKLNAAGLTPTIMGNTYAFDSFEPKFRELAYTDWAIKYDPEDLSTVLVVNAKTDPNTKRVIEVLANYRFELNQKHLQPMALYDRKEGDAEKMHEVFNYNKTLEQSVIERRVKNMDVLEKTFIENPQLNDTLTKMVLSDSNGQHKDERNKAKKINTKKPKELPVMHTIPHDAEIIDEDVRDQY